MMAEIAELGEKKSEITSVLQHDHIVSAELKESKETVLQEMTGLRKTQCLLKEELFGIELEISKTQKLLSLCVGELKDAQEQYVRVNLENTALQTSIRNNTIENTRISRSIEELEEKFESEDRIHHKKTTLLHEIEGLQRNFDAMQTEVQTQHAHQQACEIDLVAALAKVERVHKNTEVLEMQEEKLSANKEEIICSALQIEGQNNKICDLNDHIKTLVLEETDMQNQIQETRMLLADLDNDIDESYAKQKSISAMTAGYADQVLQCESIQDHIVELNEQKESMELVATKMKAQANNTKLEIQNLILITEEKNYEIQELTQKSADVFEEHSALCVKLSEVELQHTEKTTDIDSLNTQITMLGEQFKHFSVSEQMIVHVTNKLQTLSVEEETLLLKNSQMRADYDSYCVDIAHRQNELNKLNTEYICLEDETTEVQNRMTETLTLIREQQEKSQQIEHNINVISKQFENVLFETNQSQSRHEALEEQQTRKISDMRLAANILLQENTQLQAKTLQIQTDLSELECEKTVLLQSIQTESEELLLYQEKLKFVNVYCDQVGIVADMVFKLHPESSDLSKSNINAISIGKMISLLNAFVDWFESTFLHRLNILSDMMITSQIRD
jgi:chromosome segregation ATPase